MGDETCSRGQKKEGPFEGMHKRRKESKNERLEGRNEQTEHGVGILAVGVISVGRDVSARKTTVQQVSSS